MAARLPEPVALSIIVPVLDEAARLDACLARLTGLAQGGDTVEIIVVDVVNVVNDIIHYIVKNQKSSIQNRLYLVHLSLVVVHHPSHVRHHLHLQQVTPQWHPLVFKS